jgi:hypothetical protein
VSTTRSSSAPNLFDLPAGFTAAYTTSCNSGELLTGGGSQLAAPPAVKVIDSYASGGTYTVTVLNTAAFNQQGVVTVYAQCIKGASAVTTRQSPAPNLFTLPAGAAASYTTSCNAGEILTGGGFSLGAPPAVKVIDEYSSGGTYKVTVLNTAGFNQTGVVTVFAQCLG